MILFRRMISACKACLSGSTCVSCFTCLVIARSLTQFRSGTKSDPGERLVDMYAVKLLTETAETDGVVALENLPDAILQTVLGDFQIAQHAVADQNQLGRPD